MSLREVWLLWESDKIVEGVHSRDDCKGFCTVHNPSEHLLRGARLDYDSKKNCFTRVCEHNRTHIDPDEQAYWLKRYTSTKSPSGEVARKATSKLWSYLCPLCDCGCCNAVSVLARSTKKEVS